MVTGIGTMATVNSNTQQIPLKEVPTPPVKSDRRSNKPIMEKRRRARINNCLNELKTLILDATKKDPARHSKLEKADILEKTVKHLQELQRQQSVMVQATDPKIVNKFKAGFTECANEVSRFPGLDTQVKRRLMQHLSNCINGVKSELSQIRQQQQITSNSQQQHILPSPPSSPEQDHHQHHTNHQQINQQQQQQQQQQHIQTTTTISTTQIQATVNGYFLPNGVQVYPTKLSNGTFALILPQTVPQATQLPMLVPIPSRTASTGSATSIQSNVSNYDRTHSPIMNQQQQQHSQQHQHHHHHHQQQQQQNVINHYAPPSPANSYEAMDYQPNHHHHTSVIHHASSSHHQNNHHLNQHHRQSPNQHIQPSYSPDIESGPISLVMKKNNNDDTIKEEEQPWRPW